MVILIPLKVGRLLRLFKIGFPVQCNSHQILYKMVLQLQLDFLFEYLEYFYKQPIPV